MKGLGLFNYSSITTAFKTMMSKPESLKYNNDFSSDYYKRNPVSLNDASKKCKIYIGTVSEGKNEDIKSSNFSKVLPRDFNSATAGNAMKWSKLLNNNEVGNYNFETADRITDYVIKNNCRMRGHVLVWGRTPNGGYPAAIDDIIKTSSNPKEEVRDIIKNHIFTVLGHFKGRVKNWDVVNEPMQVFGADFAGYSLYNLFGTDYIKDSFRFAREADSTVKLYLNEQFFNYRDKRAKKFLNLVKEMISEGVPIDGVGLQHHIMYNEQSIEDLKWFLSQVKDMGLTVEITELDIRMAVFKKSKNPELSQAEAYYKIVKACKDSGICEGITVWGVDDGNNWYDYTPPFNSKKAIKMNQPLLFDANLTKKPVYYGFRQGLID